MEIIINPNLESINWETISTLFELVAWGKRPANEIKAAFETSTVVCFIKQDNAIVGFGRTVDDGRYYALLVDVVIHPNYQKQGLGTVIVNRLKEQLKGYEFVTLTAAPGKDGFYKKLGWKQQKSSYILPKDEKQELEHCVDSN